jgi:hypothetical protein
MKRNLVALAVAALLAGTVATNALAAGHAVGRVNTTGCHSLYRAVAIAAMRRASSRVLPGQDPLCRPCNIPKGSIAAYCPETNNLVPLSYHDKKSKTPSAKSIPVIVRPLAGYGAA